jgi:histidine triad (HIT) family protein
VSAGADRCIFCAIMAGKAPAEIIWSDDRFVAFLDISPITAGHVLLIPRAHVSSVYELEGNLYAELFLVARDLASAIQNVVGSRRVGLAVEGFGVDHAHLHLVPVNRIGDLDPCRQKKATPESLREVGDALRAMIDPTYQ